MSIMDQSKAWLIEIAIGINTRLVEVYRVDSNRLQIQTSIDSMFATNRGSFLFNKLFV